MLAAQLGVWASRSNLCAMNPRWSCTRATPRSACAGSNRPAGGTTFGLGWALTGACPGPLVALVGAGAPVMMVTIVSALVGTWTYGMLRPRLPH